MTNLASLPHFIRPVGAYQLQGLMFSGEGKAITVDTYRGYVLEVDPFTESAKVLNRHTYQQFCGVTAIAGDATFWVVKGNDLFYCNPIDFKLNLFLSLPHPIEGLAVAEGAIYLSCRAIGKIMVFGRATRGLLRVIPSPGIGATALTLHLDHLWAVDQAEETVYQLDPKSGNIHLRALTPFPQPRGLAFWAEQLYVTYSGDEYYIRDNPNDPEPYSVQVRDRTFIHRFQWLQVAGSPSFTLSNGYLVEMTYLEEFCAEDPQPVQNLTWRIALPENSDRQKVLAINSLGMPMEIQEINGSKVAVFQIGDLAPGEGGMFGWKALLELRGIKYQISPEQVAQVDTLDPELQALYLVDDDGLSMDSPFVRNCAREAVGSETNILLKMLKIRNFVYDRLEYRMQPYISSPEEALTRGTASCGEYVGLLLAIARLNGIACRTVGRYKCPPFADQQNVPLYQDYNHVWIEFYIPGIGWLPMESNPDDTGTPPYPTRFFMGLPWYHVEIGKGVTFESIRPQPFSIGELALNHVRFKILGELEF
ncbi:MAG: transglutaminase family protein [Pseudanabaenaceae cyanobacterium bins.68]|nr:transglutaminase family protein [Pseudanabaenaceae cyanobacterium bins.68]